MGVYPVDNVLLLTDEIFASYGGEDLNQPGGVKQAAYWIAEEHMARHLGCLLNPLTIIERVFPTIGGTTELNWGYVNALYSIRITDNNSKVQSITGSVLSPVGSWALRDPIYGRVDVTNAIRKFLGWGFEQYTQYNALNVDVEYNSGLPTGTAQRPNMLMALTILADICLKEMSSLGLNETPGDVGVKIFTSNGYTEQRVDLIRTVLGTSARAQYARNLVGNLKLTKAYLFR